MSDFESTVLSMFGTLQSDILKNRTIATEVSVKVVNQSKVLEELNVATKKNTEALSKLPLPKVPFFTLTSVRDYLKIITVGIALVAALAGGAIKIWSSWGASPPLVSSNIVPPKEPIPDDPPPKISSSLRSSD